MSDNLLRNKTGYRTKGYIIDDDLLYFYESHCILKYVFLSAVFAQVSKKY